jgi:hypothetical protein
MIGEGYFTFVRGLHAQVSDEDVQGFRDRSPWGQLQVWQRESPPNVPVPGDAQARLDPAENIVFFHC